MAKKSPPAPAVVPAADHYSLFFFSAVPGVGFVLRPDHGEVLTAVPGTFPDGRPGWVVEVPPSVPNLNGARIVVSAPGYDTREARGILAYRDGVILWPYGADYAAVMTIDDWDLTPTVVCPEPEPEPEPIPEHQHPFAVINAIYATGLYDLNLKSGCGTFTEAVTKTLHEGQTAEWGHVQKSAGQNHWTGPNGVLHAVDAMMVRVDYMVGADLIVAGVYDIITSSESPEAKPAFNLVGPPDGRWVYPV